MPPGRTALAAAALAGARARAARPFPVQFDGMAWPSDTHPTPCRFPDALRAGSGTECEAFVRKANVTAWFQTLINFYSNCSGHACPAPCGCGPAVGHSPWPITGCDTAKTPYQYAYDRGAMQAVTIQDNDALLQSDWFSMDVEQMNGLVSRVHSEVSLRGSKWDDVYANSDTKTGFEAQYLRAGRYGIFDQQYNETHGRFIDPATITFREVIDTIADVWERAARGLRDAQKEHYGRAPEWVGEYFAFGCRAGLTTNLDFNHLTPSLDAYARAVNTSKDGFYRKHVSFARMVDDGRATEWAAAQAAPIAGLMRPPAHNTIAPSWYAGDATHWRYWNGSGHGWRDPAVSQSLRDWEDAHGTTPDDTAVANFGRGWAVVIAELRKALPSEIAIIPIVQPAFSPRIGNNPECCAGNDLQLAHWWHPDLAERILRPAFAAGMDAVSIWTYWNPEAEELDRWTYSRYLNFKHHFIAGGLQGSLPCDVAVFRGWDGQEATLPKGWHAGVDWSTVEPRPGGGGFWPFAAHVDWAAVGTDSSRLQPQITRAMQAYYYDLFPALHRAAAARPPAPAPAPTPPPAPGPAACPRGSLAACRALCDEAGSPAGKARCMLVCDENCPHA